MSDYGKRVTERTVLQFMAGALIRFFHYCAISHRVRKARRRGAVIGEDVVLPPALAKHANANLRLGNHVSIQSADIDLREPVEIGDNGIIGDGVRILRQSHDIDSTGWEHFGNPLVVEEYVWLATGAVILPGCRRIGRGAVIGASAVVAKDVPAMAVVVGNPAKTVRFRKNVHSDFVVESLLGGDFHRYCEERKKNSSDSGKNQP